MITYKFNSQTGEIILGEKEEYAPAEEFVAPPKKLPDPLPRKGNYCAYCGNQLSEEAKFCAFCGSKL